MGLLWAISRNTPAPGEAVAIGRYCQELWGQLLLKVTYFIAYYIGILLSHTKSLIPATMVLSQKCKH